MRTVIVSLSAALLASSGLTAERAVGPRANPDDQFRFFWLYSKDCYQELRDSGFNLFIDGSYGAYSVNSRRFDPKSKEARQQRLNRVLADNCDYFEKFGVPQLKEFSRKYPRILQNGKEHYNADMGWDEAMAEAMKGTKVIAEAIENHPACIGLAPSSEVRDHSKPSHREYFAKAYTAWSGEPVPPEVGDGRVAPHYLQLADFPMSRVVDENYRLLKFYKWYWKVGDGWNDYQTKAAETFEQTLGRPLLSMYDPVVRTPPLWGSGGKLTHNNQWTYPTPEPFNIHYVISEQQAMARGMPGQKVFSMVQAISYRSRLAPKEVKVENEPAWVADRPNVVYMTTPPDIMQEALWTTFSHQMDGVGVFAWRALFDATSEKYGANYKKDQSGYQFTNPQTIGTISNIFHKVGKRLGPLFKAIPERTPEVAMLESYAATIFANRGSWGWDGWIYQTGITVDAAHLQPYVLYEEEIAQSGIPTTVTVVIAPHCDVVTKGTFEALKKFQAAGGIIVADKYLVPGILPDLPLPGFSRTWKDGVTDNANLCRAAKELKESLAPFYRPPSDSDNDHLVTFLRSYKSSDYLFVINDKREFGDYVGQWKMVMEKGCPNSGKVTVRRKAGAVYDLVKHCRLEHEVLKNGDTEVAVEFTTNDGKCLLFAERELAPLKVKVEDGKITVTSVDRDVLIPIAVLVKGEAPRYAVVKDGEYVWECKSATADNVKVVNQADGGISTVSKWWCFWK